MQSADEIRESLVRRIYDINENDFEGVAIDVWKYQFLCNPLYQTYCKLLGIQSPEISGLKQIPYLPIIMFREHPIKTGEWKEQAVFQSSGTTGSIQSRHFIRDIDFYHAVTKKCFTVEFEDPANYIWIGLLPSYLERADSSLVNMVQFFIQSTGQGESAFYPKADKDFFATLEVFRMSNRKTILIGVSFALLDLFETYSVKLWDNLTIIETGGMKGRGPEITRDELYTRMRNKHPDLKIASEYGMTELLSQAYKVNAHFRPGPSMRVYIRDISDPLSMLSHNLRGVINIMDLANIDTCSFIATDDVGVSFTDGSFDVLGRLDNSDLRGCNLMYV